MQNLKIDCPYSLQNKKDVELVFFHKQITQITTRDQAADCHNRFLNSLSLSLANFKIILKYWPCPRYCTVQTIS